MLNYPDPVPQTRIRIPTLVTTYVVCFVGVVDKQPWLCSRVIILFLCFDIVLFHKKFVYLKKCLSIASASVLFQPAPAHTPPPFPFRRRGTVVLFMLTRNNFDLIRYVSCL